jgi:hypothetical protein
MTVVEYVVDDPLGTTEFEAVAGPAPQAFNA